MRVIQAVRPPSTFPRAKTGVDMMRSILLMTAVCTLFSAANAQAKPCQRHKNHVLLIHGGAGAGKSPPAVLEKKREVMKRALRQGHALLRKGGSAVDAVTAAVRILEDPPLFNAGRGGIPNRAGFVELDASLMEGRRLTSLSHTDTVTHRYVVPSGPPQILFRLPPGPFRFLTRPPSPGLTPLAATSAHAPCGSRSRSRGGALPSWPWLGPRRSPPRIRHAPGGG